MIIVILNHLLKINVILLVDFIIQMNLIKLVRIVDFKLVKCYFIQLDLQHVLNY